MESGRRMMYEREVDVPRLRAHFRADDPALPDALKDALAAIIAAVGVPFESIGLNLYRDQHDSVSPHNDKLDGIVRGQPVALLSLGAMRRMTIRAKQPPRRVLQVDLEPGSLLPMNWETQLHYDHGIPRLMRGNAAAHQPGVPRARRQGVTITLFPRTSRLRCGVHREMRRNTV